MSATTLDRSESRTPEQRAHDRFAARRAMAAARADVSVCENQALLNAASEALVTRRRLEANKQ
jgi:hypothetical protein